MRRSILFFLLLVAVQAAQGQVAATFYVDGGPNGTDALGRGGETNPWKTIGFALEQLQTVNGDITVLVADGTYEESTPITITSPEWETLALDVLTNQGGVTIKGLSDSESTNALFEISDAQVTFQNLIFDANINETEKIAQAISVSDPTVLDATSLTVLFSEILGFPTGISFTSDVEIEIRECFFENNTIGILVSDGESDVPDKSTAINTNSLTSNTVAVVNESSLIINAEYNWWGSEEADVVEEVTGSGVDYSPWLNTDDDEAIFGFQGSFLSVTLGGGPSYDVTRNELQEAHNEGGTNRLVLVGPDLSYPDLATNKEFTLASTAGVLSVGSLTVGATLSVEGQMRIDESITINSGNFQTLESSQVTLGADVEDISETEGRLIGRFVADPRNVGIGSLSFLGVDISTGSEDIGDVAITRITGQQGIVTQTVDEANNESIAVTWIIDAQAEPEADGRTLDFTWHEDFDNGKRFDSPVIWHLPDGEDQVWEPIPAVYEEPNSSTAQDFRTAQTISRINQFSTWTVSDVNSPLPVTLTDFTARLDESSVRLQWATASEINSDYFSIERSTDGLTYQPLGRRQAAGESQTEQTYQYFDEGVANRLAGTIYYRLHMVDFDGSAEYSPVIGISLKGESSLLVYADRGGTFKLFASLPEEAYTVQVSDLLGNIVYETALLTQSNVREYALSVPTLPQSVYTLRCLGAKELYVQKFRVE